MESGLLSSIFVNNINLFPQALQVINLFEWILAHATQRFMNVLQCILFVLLDKNQLVNLKKDH